MSVLNKNKFVVILGIVLLALGCFRKPPSFGDETHLFVITDQDNWDTLQSSLREAFERVIATPQPEKVFEVHWVAPEKFNQFATRKNLALVGILGSEGEINEQVSNMLATDVKQRVVDGTAYVFPKNDPWAKQQLLLVLAGNSIEQLKKNLQQNREYLYNFFKKKLTEETRQKMFEQLEQVELGREILDKYGWTLRVQHDYNLSIERVQDRFIMLRRSLPGRERWLYVHWIEHADPNLINEEWALKTRARLSKKFYGNDKINRNYTNAKEIDFLNRSTLLLTGLWENDDKKVGGPFRNYSFYDNDSGRIYTIDVAVYFPGGKKEPFLRQLDVMAHTFKTAFEIEQEKLTD